MADTFSAHDQPPPRPTVQPNSEAMTFAPVGGLVPSYIRCRSKGEVVMCGRRISASFTFPQKNLAFPPKPKRPCQKPSHPTRQRRIRLRKPAFRLPKEKRVAQTTPHHLERKEPAHLVLTPSTTFEDAPPKKRQCARGYPMRIPARKIPGRFRRAWRAPASSGISCGRRCCA